MAYTPFEIQNGLTVSSGTSTLMGDLVSAGTNIYLKDPTLAVTIGQIYALTQGIYYNTPNNSAHIFRTNGTEQFRITNTGALALQGAYGTAGQVLQTNGSAAAASWVTNAPAWANITSKPTTRAGYGITDAASSTATTTIGTTAITIGGSSLTLAGLTSVAATTFTGALTGNASTATKLATARSITLTGAVTGTASFDGSADASIAASIAASGVTAGVYGSTTDIPVVTVGADGRVTSVSTVTAAAGSIVTDAAFTITGSVDATKIAKFEVDGFTTGTTRTFTLPNVTGTLATTAAVTQSFTGNTTFSGGTLVLGNSTATSAANIGIGATVSGATKNIAIGTGGVAGSTTNIVIGSPTGTSTTTLQGQTNIASASFGPNAHSVFTDDGYTFTATTAAAACVFSKTLYRSAFIDVSITRGTEYQMCTLHVIHNGTAAYLIEYGVIQTGVDLGSFDASIVDSSVFVNFTPTSATSTVVKASLRLIKV